uniref:DNA-directed RNA polymerase subunit n=1 Tax=Rhodosorus marinus TaxID=101924 RepID=A0A7S2ZAA3_9RHOD|mmetsp:Transcript_11184/g.46739  ORF Transcript_11184/g.46739 Transcript_11184/m.46739 type:complete len:1581 (+) Transcript_11184:59-4801(+)
MDVSASDPKSRDVGHHVRALAFSFYTSDEVRALSVKAITNPTTFDDMGRPVQGGLYDLALGTTSHKELCVTCHLGYQECPGHFGHIELAVPAVNPLLYGTLLKILKAKCWYCNRFRAEAKVLNFLLAKLFYIDSGLTKEAMEIPAPDGSSEHSEMKSTEILREAKERWSASSKLRTRMNRTVEWREAVNDFLSITAQGPRCHRCKMPKIKLRRDQAKIFRLASSSLALKTGKVVGHKLESLSGKLANAHINDDVSAEQLEGGEEEAGMTRLVSSVELEQQLIALWKVEHDACELLWGCRDRFGTSKGAEEGYNVFFIKAMAVPPSRFRPASRDVETDTPTEHPQNVFLGRILNANVQLLTGSSTLTNIQRTRLVLELQTNLNSLVDSTQTAKAGGPPGTMTATGIRQQLEHKEGLFRMHMMGKRVNHSARSVIGPDPFLETSEVGVPMSFAKKMYYAEPVSQLNAEKLRKLVENGPDVYPGAYAVEDENGNLITLQANKPRQRIAQAKLLQKTIGKGPGLKSKRVYRHLESGDVVLFNRQPSLHRASIMAHTVRVLPKERTIRFHYANCGSYNADFDGDEMNLHFPQDEVSRAEARTVVLADRQYTTPTSGLPLRGLIQDHVVSGVLLTKRDTFLSREEFQQLCYSACFNVLGENRRVVLPTPAILKPRQLWTGKQLVSLVLKLVGSKSMDVKFNLKAKSRTKSDVVGDEEAEVLVLDGDLLKGVLDKNQFGSSPYGLVHSYFEIYGAEAAGSLLSTLSRLFTLYLRGHAHTTGIDDLIMDQDADKARFEILRGARRNAGAKALTKIFKLDEANGTAMDHSQASAYVEKLASERDGDARLDAAMKSILSGVSSEVLSACFPGGLVKRFPHNGFALMTGTGAKGSIVNSSQISCQLGQTELEGRRVPRSASGATLPCFAPFDCSARAGGYITGRFLTGIKPPEYFFHCMAGREGLVDTAVKTARSGYLQRCLVKALEGVQLKYDMTVRDSDDSILQFIYGDDGIDPSKSSWLLNKPGWQAMNSEELLGVSGEGAFENLPGLSDEQRKSVEHYVSRGMDEGGSTLDDASASDSGLHGAVSEMFWAKVCKYATDDPNGLVAKMGRGNFEKLMLLRYRKSAAEPGDAVGVLAAQGIGEPSTQMTLNTFHFAGMGAAHVTLGIPRLRELLMTASKTPKTPTMNLPLLSSIDPVEGERFMRLLRRIRVTDLLKAFSVQDCGFTGTGQVTRDYKVGLEFPHESVYSEALDLSFEQIHGAVSKKFAVQLKSAITKAIRKLGTSRTTGVVGTEKIDTNSESDEEKPDNSKTKTAEVGTDDEEDEPDPLESETVDAHEADASDARMAQQRGEGATYYDDEADEEEDLEVSEEEEQDEEPEHDDAKKDQIKQLETRFIELSISLPVSAWGRVMVEDVVKEVANTSVLRETPRISMCYMEQADDGSAYVQTEGSNLQAVWAHEDYIDVDKVMTNDIYLILQTYGVEAARKALIHELSMVFKAYGIPVDNRHLSIIADYMTANGGYRPFNRSGMDTAPSGIQKMSFETSLKFLTDAAMNAEIDHLESPSARIAVGEIAKCGTGMFDLLQSIRA